MKRLLTLFILFALTRAISAQPPRPSIEPCHTFSIVAMDPATKEWGVAVASKVLAVGSVVSWAKAGAGAVATQSYANITFGPRGLDLLASGKSAKQTLETLLASDEGKELRQVGIIDAEGNIAHFTGMKCFPWAGAKAGKNFTCQGNLLAGEKVVDAMADTFEKAKGPFAWRLAAALEAGESAGGDKRGKQSAAILVVRAGAGYFGGDRTVDLRVDDHESPISELLRILAKRVPRP